MIEEYNSVAAIRESEVGSSDYFDGKLSNNSVFTEFRRWAFFFQ